MTKTQIIEGQDFYAEIIDISLEIHLRNTIDQLRFRKNKRKLQSDIAHDRLERILQKNRSATSSISHSGDFVFVAMSTRGKIGIDVEKIKYEKNRTSTLSEEEKLVLLKNGINFTTLWTLKEAIFKSQYPNNKELLGITVLDVLKLKRIVKVRFRDILGKSWENECYYFSKIINNHVFSIVIFD